MKNNSQKALRKVKEKRYLKLMMFLNKLKCLLKMKKKSNLRVQEQETSGKLKES